MKTTEEIIENKRLLIGVLGADGGQGVIHIGNWTGSVVWSFGGGWDHVSVAPHKRRITPSWDDMCKIKDMFFEKEECVVQYHPRESEYVSNVSNCLHLWRKQDGSIPEPPSIMVGLKNIGNLI